MTIAEVRDVTYTYGRRAVALRGVSFDLESGVTALLGPNAAGKSTLIELLVGLRRPGSGSLEVLGTGRASRRSRRTLAPLVGYLPQRLGYVPGFTVEEFVSYAAWLKAIPTGLTAEYVKQALASANLEKHAQKKMRALSGGTLRRAGIAAALVAQPALVVLDEPAAGLDPEQTEDLRQVLLGVGSSGASVLLSTHSIEDAAAVCSQLVVLSEGAVAFTGSQEQFLQASSETEPTLRDAYMAVVRGAGV